MLSNIRIKQNLLSGNIVIDPFKEEQLQTNSYDVCLGEWTVRQKISNLIEYNSKSGAQLMWNEPVFHENGLIIIYPKETLLAHTKEVIGGRNTITTEMRAKSTTARYGLSVCKCAGLGDVGFISKWTMEITNHTKHTILIKVGEPIAQILFHEIGEVNMQYKGRYGQGEWTPMDMIPKGKYE